MNDYGSVLEVLQTETWAIKFDVPLIVVLFHDVADRREVCGRRNHLLPAVTLGSTKALSPTWRSIGGHCTGHSIDHISDEILSIALESSPDEELSLLNLILFLLVCSKTS